MPALRAASISRLTSLSDGAPAAMWILPSARTRSEEASIRAATLLPVPRAAARTGLFAADLPVVAVLPALADDPCRACIAATGERKAREQQEERGPTRASAGGQGASQTRICRSARSTISRAAAFRVVGGDEVIADREREGEHAAGLDLVRVLAERADQRAQVLHPPVVHPPQAPGDRPVAPRPVAHGEVDREQPPREHERSRTADLLPGRRPRVRSRSQRLVGAAALPRVEHLVRRRRRSAKCRRSRRG